MTYTEALTFLQTHRMPLTGAQLVKYNEALRIAASAALKPPENNND